VSFHQVVEEPMNRIYPLECECEGADGFRNALYLGGFDGATMCEALEVRSVRTVVSILHQGAPPVEPRAEGVLFWRSPPVEDGSQGVEALEALLDEAHAQIDAGLASGSSVLVHCMMGVSRSATVVAAYLMRRLGLSRKEALERVVSARSCARPNASFYELLGRFEARSEPVALAPS